MKTMMAQMLGSFGPSFETAVAEAPGSSAVTSPGAPAAPSTPEPAEQPTPAAGSSAAPSSAPGDTKPRMHTSDEVSKIVSERVNETNARWKDFGDPKALKERLARAERLEKALKGEDKPEDQLTAEDKEFRTYMEKMYPEVAQMRSFSERQKAMETVLYQQQAKEGQGILAGLVEKSLGSRDEKTTALVDRMVADSIMADEESRTAWFQKRDMSVLAKHFEKVWNSEIEPVLQANAARYSDGKAKDKREVPPQMPRGGAPAATSKDRQLTPDERRDAARKFFRDGK